MPVSEKKTSEKDNEEIQAADGGKEVTLEEALKLAQAHHQNNNLTIAERTYRDILNAVPDHFPTVYHLAALLYQRGDFDEAMEFGKKSVEADPENTGCWTNYGIILSVNGKNEEAVEAFDEALSIQPELYEAWSNKAYALFQLGRYEESEEAAAQATIIDEERIDGYLNLGIALAAQRKDEEALEIWEQLAEMSPDNSKVFANWCNTLRYTGQFIEARNIGEKATELDPDNAEAWNNLANVMRDLGEMDEALKVYRKATDAKPDYADAHSNMAFTYLEQLKYPEAITAARYALSFDEKHKEANITLFTALLGLGRRDEAYKASEKAIRLEPDEPIYYLNMVDALLAMGSEDEAEAVLKKALELDPDSSEALVKLAEINQNMDMMDEAVAALDRAMKLSDETPSLLLQKARIYQHLSKPEKALEIVDYVLSSTPRNLGALLTKAEVLLTTNRKDEAAEVMEQARAIADGAPSFYANLSAFKKFTKDDPDFEALKKIADDLDKYSLESQSNICFTLFKGYQDVGEYDQAFEYLKKGNDLKLEELSYNPDTIGAHLQSRVSSFSQEFIESFEGLGCESNVPLFICGMPRSGTTLTEQIISSHPDVYGAGELYDLSTVIRVDGPLKHENAKQMGEAYLARMKARDPDDALYITDKMPGNCNNIGLIKCILPNARIIVCNRNPMDNLFSCYKQNFAIGHLWSYNLEYAARQYIAYRKMIEHWRNVLPEGSFMEIDYEDTVNNFEDRARALIDYVELPWNDACLEPHKQKRSVLTASKNQVIKPIYKTSVEAWRRYEKQLQPMYDVLKEAGLVE